MAIRNYLGGTLVEEWDTATGLYTRYNGLGTVVAQRALTADEVAKVQERDRTAAEAGAVAQAKQQIDTMHAATAEYRRQLAADIDAVGAGWQTLSADDQTGIVLRILNGFTTVLSGLLSHAVVTQSIDPLATPQDQGAP